MPVAHSAPFLHVFQMRPFVAALALTLVLATAGRARAGERDPWFGRDKALHFAASAGLAAGGYAAGALLWERQELRLVFGAGLSLGAGAAKELIDLAGAGDPSWRDMAWNVAGATTGLLAAWAVDRAITGARTTPREDTALLLESLALARHALHEVGPARRALPLARPLVSGGPLFP